MTFWMGVATAYAVIITVGVALGSLLAGRFPNRGGGRGFDSPPPTPYGGPSFAADLPGDLPFGVPPLGSDFDRELLPAAFVDVTPAR
jgi:hypothetical protein